MNLECSKCLLSADVPGVLVNDQRICSVCREHDRVWGDWNDHQEKLLLTFEKIIDSAQKKNRIYDVLVPLSGGKDSMYVLYLCRKQYNLKCLAVTWDNGFLSEHARENIRNACEILDVDHLYYGLSKKLLMRLYGFFFRKTGFFCPVCMRGIQVTISRAQIAFNIPLAIRGTSRRTEEHIAPEFFIPGNLSFLENVLKGTSLAKEAEALLFPVGIISSPPQIQLPDYIKWDYDEIYNKIHDELKWEAPTEDAEHIDCKVANIVDYIRYKKFPALVPELLRFSKLVTANQITREEALLRVSEKRALIREPYNLVWFENAIGISKQEMDSVLADPLRHMKYTQNHSRVLRRLRALKHRLLP